MVLREIVVYKEGYLSPKFKHRVAPGYRKIVCLEEGEFSYSVKREEDVEAVVLDICEVWYQS